jgi:hypothetical protein
MMPEWYTILKKCGYPTDVVVLDFETYFDTEYSMRKMSTIEYVMDERFETLGVGVHEQTQPYQECDPYWRGGNAVDQILLYLKREYGNDLDRCTLVAQNAGFECTVLAFRYGIKPRYVVDILGLARHFDARQNNDLDALCKRHRLPPKGDTKEFTGWTHRTRLVPRTAKQRRSNTPPSLRPRITETREEKIADYCCNDVAREWDLFQVFMPLLSRPEMELRVMQHTMNQLTTPKLAVDYELGTDLVKKMEGRIDELIAATGHTRAEISGRMSFEKLFREACSAIKETVPLKVNASGTYILALAKDDPQRERFEQHPDPTIRGLVQAKNALTAWRNHANRVCRIMDQCRAAGGLLPVPLKYHGAHCLPGNAEVLTKTGWQRLDVWTGGDIMQWKPDGSVAFHAATPNKFANNEPMVRLTAGRVCGLFTAGHQLPGWTSRANFSVVQAGDRPHISKFPLGGRRTDRADVWRTRLVVAIQADGHWCRKHAGRKLRFHVRKMRKVRRIVVILRRLHLLHDVRIDADGTYRIIVRHRHIPDWLPYGRKSLADWGFLLDSGTVTREVPHWDGNYNGRGLEYTSCDRASAEWVQIHANVSGYAASICIRSRRDSGWRDSWRVYISRCNTAHIRPRHWTFEDPISTVYCPTTKTGYFLCRYEDHIFVSHNTGRWSGGEKINLHNLPSRNPDDLINSVRNILIAPEGKELVISDASQIEARVLAWVAGQQDLCDMFAKGVEIYCVYAGRMVGQRLRKARDTDPPELKKFLVRMRNMGKVQVLGGGYGMGWCQCMSFASSTYRVELTEPEARTLIRTYRESVPQITEFWNDIEKHFAMAVKWGQESRMSRGLRFYRESDSVVVIELPNTRKLRYHDPRVTGIGWNREISIVNHIERKRVRLWGGHLTENVVQAMSRDILAEALLKMEDEGCPIPLTVHDELVGVVDEGQGKTVLPRMNAALSTPPDWAPDCPLGAEGKVSKCYVK